MWFTAFGVVWTFCYSHRGFFNSTIKCVHRYNGRNARYEWANNWQSDRAFDIQIFRCVHRRFMDSWQDMLCFKSKLFRKQELIEITRVILYRTSKHICYVSIFLYAIYINVQLDYKSGRCIILHEAYFNRKSP